MWLNELRQRWLGRPPARRKTVRLTLEHLENRLVPATFNATDVPTLITDINTANGNGTTNTINLMAPTGLYVLNAANNSTDGPTGLPVITSPFLLTINGNWATIERSSVGGTPAFRLFDVASGAALTLKNVTLANGLSFGSGASADGGAIYNKGKLSLNGAVLRSNFAQGSNVTALGTAGHDAAGGGIWTSGGSLTLTGSTVLKFDGAFGGNGSGNGGNAFGGGIYANLTKVSIGAGTIVETCKAFGGVGSGSGASGGNASGGGIYATGSTTALISVALTGATVQNDEAGGSFGRNVGARGGDGNGGGVFVNDATLALSGDHIENNVALGGTGVTGGRSGSGGNGGNASGGGLYASGGSLTESSFLLVQGNLAQGGNGGYGGSGKHGGAGGSGGNASGGGMYTVGTTVKLTAAATLQYNVAIGGLGAVGGGLSTAGTVGTSGNGGNASGGALYATASGAIGLVLENAIVENNGATGGHSGQGVFGVFGSGTGGNGGTSSGGALYLAQNATLLSDNINSNIAGNLSPLKPNVSFPKAPVSAAGGLGSSGGHGGNGGNSAGGALFVAAGTITLGSSVIDSNEAIGGHGGNTDNHNAPGTAGVGGTASGGAVAMAGGTLSVKSSSVESNLAIGGTGGGHYNARRTAFSATAFQGAGGAAYGGGLYISGGTLHFTLDDVESNHANAGASPDGTRSTADSGGGLYKAGGTTTVDALTMAHIINNADSNNDAFNNIGP